MARDKSIQSKASDPEKYFKLSLSITLLFLGFLMFLVLLFLLMRLLFDAMRFMPWLDYVFAVMLVCTPGTLMITAYSIFFLRTKRYPIRTVKIVSLIIMAFVVVCWAYLLVSDLIHFFITKKLDIGSYQSYEKFWLIGSVALIFILGVIQALALPREPDWLEKLTMKEDASD